jgi:hypothetical protein
MELLATTSVSAENDEHYGVIAEHTLRIPRSDIVATAVTFAHYLIRGMGVAVGTVFGTPRVVYGSPKVKVRDTSLVSTVEGAEPDDEDPAEAAMRSARFWLPDSEDLHLVRHDSPPSPSSRLHSRIRLPETGLG